MSLTPTNLGLAWKTVVPGLFLLGAVTFFTFGQAEGIGVVFGAILNQLNLVSLEWTLQKASEAKRRKLWVAIQYYLRIIALIIILYAAYHLIGRNFVVAALGGMLVHKIFFVILNVSILFLKDTIK